MKLAQFTDPQILDASAPGGLNPAFGLVSGSFASVGLGTWAAPGLSAPEAMTVSFSGMTATVGLPSPWGLVSSGGVLVRAHGVQTGQETPTYSVNLTSLVPASGTRTAYLTAAVSTIQQGPFPVPGPPPGHPAYDPNYVPSIAYAATVYTVALAAASGGVDNVNTFELLRTTLSAGQSTVTNWSTAGQIRAADREAWPPAVLTSGGLLSPSQAPFMLLPSVSGLTHTLPPVSGGGGLTFGGINPTTGPWTLATTGGDRIAGLGASGTASLVVAPSGAVLLWANAVSGIWQLLGSSPNMVPVAAQQWIAGNVSSVSGAVVSGTTLIAAPLAGSPTQGFSVAALAICNGISNPILYTDIPGSPWGTGDLVVETGPVGTRAYTIFDSLGNILVPGNASVAAATQPGHAVALGQFGTWVGGSTGYFLVPNPSAPTVPWIVQVTSQTCSSANTATTAPYPIAFPHAVIQVVASSLSLNSYAGYIAAFSGLSFASVFSSNAGGAVSIIAVGY